uniref:Uncharacterized protein n=1 Tax=Ananas comosus var. bracteatus TaxID=296719 RepID=A0A6V7P444_ANACO|nr:unnamed protein product [Ananas comosus var. bracteatus]
MRAGLSSTRKPSPIQKKSDPPRILFSLRANPLEPPRILFPFVQTLSLSPSSSAAATDELGFRRPEFRREDLAGTIAEGVSAKRRGDDGGGEAGVRRPGCVRGGVEGVEVVDGEEAKLQNKRAQIAFDRALGSPVDYHDPQFLGSGIRTQNTQENVNGICKSEGVGYERGVYFYAGVEIQLLFVELYQIGAVVQLAKSSSRFGSSLSLWHSFSRTHLQIYTFTQLILTALAAYGLGVYCHSGVNERDDQTDLSMPVELNIRDIGRTEKFSKRNTSDSTYFGTNSKLKRPMRSKEVILDTSSSRNIHPHSRCSSGEGGEVDGVAPGGEGGGGAAQAGEDRRSRGQAEAVTERHHDAAAAAACRPPPAVAAACCRVPGGGRVRGAGVAESQPIAIATGTVRPSAAHNPRVGSEHPEPRGSGKGYT